MIDFSSDGLGRTIIKFSLVNGYIFSPLTQLNSFYRRRRAATSPVRHDQDRHGPCGGGRLRIRVASQVRLRPTPGFLGYAADCVGGVMEICSPAARIAANSVRAVGLPVGDSDR